MKKLRLLITDKCNRNCEGCCNKQWDLSKLPVEHDYQDYDEIMLTGGEPMLDPKDTLDIIDMIRNEFGYRGKIYMYTAKTWDKAALYQVLMKIDGLTVTLHDGGDCAHFRDFHYFLYDKLKDRMLDEYTFRLNVFKGVGLWNFFRKKELDGRGGGRIMWKIRDEIEWTKDCPLPENEVFKRFA